VRRLAALLVFGLIHLLLIWNGDILVEYALAGLLVLPFLLGSKPVLIAAAAAGLGLYLLGPLLPLSPALPSRAWMARRVADATQTYSSGGFVDILSFRIHELPAILPLHVMIFPRTLALMLLGVLAWRAGVFRREAVSGRKLLAAAVLCFALAGAEVIGVASGWLGAGAPAWIAEGAGTVVLACGYAALVVWAVDCTRAAGWLAWAAPVGRMALSNYLAQSVIFGFLFYGYGLGLFGRLPIAEAMAIGIAVYAVQAVVSAIWLRRYLFGPAEWLWRTAMYGTKQPLRRTERASQAGAGLEGS
jgi:uncharacterized protein